MQLKNHVAAVAPAAVIGALCGLLGGGFTALNLKIARLRAAATPARTGRSSSQSLAFCPDHPLLYMCHLLQHTRGPAFQNSATGHICWMKPPCSAVTA